MEHGNISLSFGSLNINPVPFDNFWLNQLIPKNIAGAYLLINNGLTIYVGRSDTCLFTRLTKHEHKVKATHVVWKVASSPIHAYHQECYWYAHFKGVTLNQIEPARPIKQLGRSPFL